MSSAILEFTPADRIGKVASVDTSRVLIDVSDSVLLTSLGIGQLLAIKGATQQEYLVAIAEKVTRTLGLELPDDIEGDESQPLSTTPSDLIRGALIGTFRLVKAS